jgi:glutathione S-transferase
MSSRRVLPILYGGATSPFARMTKIYGEFLGVQFTYKSIDIYNADFIDPLNPLRQIPTLVTEKGDAIYDSRTIFSFFEHLANQPQNPTDFQESTRIALAIGMSDACLQYRMETVLPEGAQSQAKLDKLKQRMNRCVAQLERFADITLSKDVNLEQIVLACALEYLDFRYTQEWRAYCPKLSNWLSEFSMRMDMQTTRPPQA